MATADLLLNYKYANGLDAFRQSFENFTGMQAFGERFSSNYVDGHYFSGIFGGVTIDLAISDDTEHQDLAYYIHMDAPDMRDEELRAFADEVVRNSLLPNGFSGAFFVNFGLPREERIDY